MENSMEKRLQLLEEKVARIADREALNNLVAKHNFYYSAGQGRRIVEELWSLDETSSVEYGASGVYAGDRGTWKISTFYVKPVIPGKFATFTASNGHIRIAEDGNSAFGVWMVLGTETDAGDLATVKPAEDDQRRNLFSSATVDGREYRAEVLLQKHAFHFVKVEGKWKIHNLHVSEYFRCPAGEDWVSYAKKRQVTDGMWLEDLFESLDEIYPRWGAMRAENLPSGSTTYHWQYDVDAVPVLQFELEDEV